jgi:hypothetical protein
MAFRKFFGGGEEQEEEYREATLETMRVGYIVDYDLRTWEVVGCGTYDYDGYISSEWELRAGDDLCFLEGGEEDGRLLWTLTSAILIGALAGDIAGDIRRSGDPAEEVGYSGKAYRSTEHGAGLYRKDGQGEGREFVSWSFAAEDGHLLFLTQWGESEFSAFVGEQVEEYQFTDILPVEREQ